MTENQIHLKALMDAAAREMGGEQFDAKQALLARYAMARYEAFLKAGFTPDQAIQLVK